MRIKVPHYDRRRNAFFHRDSALAGRRHYPSHRRGVALEPTRCSDSPRRPRDMHGFGFGSWGGTEGRTCAVRSRDVLDEGAAVYDECVTDASQGSRTA